MISYFDFAQQILLGESLQDKLINFPINWGEWKSFEVPKVPGRSGRILFSQDQMKFPKGNGLNENEKKAMAIHSFANHELLAIEMMACALLTYPHGDEESLRFKKGILSALIDEQKHFSLYVKRLNDLGHEFGDFPLNDFFWRQMEKLKTKEQYVAVMSFTFEAANLDFAQYYSNVFRSFDDIETARILEIVLHDEISHVSFGSYWLKRWRQDRSLWDYYRENLPWPMTPARGKGIGFDPSLHMQAVNDKDFIEELKAYNDDFRITKRS